MRLDQYTGVTHHDRDRSTPGYVLLAPCGGLAVHLVDYEGVVYHTWTVRDGGVTFCAELLPNGNLWVNERAPVRKGVEICPDFNELPAPGFGKVNWLFRARHYAAGSSEVAAALGN